MEHIRHRVGIAAPPARVYAALATREGLAGWWAQQVEGEATPGGMLQFFFDGNPDPRMVMEVVDLTPTQRVGWRCLQGPEEWVGTALTFEVRAAEEETVVLFTHAWRDPVEFLHHCSTKWAYFLVGLKTWLEGGASVANPNDRKISSWG